MFYLIGLGLNEKGYSREAHDAIGDCEKIYLENYTVDFPYEIKNLEKEFKGKKLIFANRDFVESFKILDGAKKENVALLVYGNPLMATTHISLIEEAEKRKIKFAVVHGASVLDAVSETGLQIYKFGKITSMPAWIPEKKFTPESFIDIVKENLSIDAHSLILADIGLKFSDALNELKIAGRNRKIKFDKILVCEKLGTSESKIFYGHISEFEGKKISSPFCFIIPAKLHFMEKEFFGNLVKF